jgi:hypothetical protein
MVQKAGGMDRIVRGFCDRINLHSKLRDRFTSGFESQVLGILTVVTRVLN